MTTTASTQPHDTAPASSANPAPAAAGQEAGYDVKGFLRAAGGRAGFSPLASPELREDATEGVEVVDEAPAEIAGTALDVVGFLDGIQNQIVVAFREHRPVVLTYCAAGVVGAGSRLVGLNERLLVYCSAADAEWVDSINTGPMPIPVRQVAEVIPPEVEAAVSDQVRELRSEVEIALRDTLLGAMGTTDVLVLDGGLVGAGHDPRLVAVAKTASTRYLVDESTLFRLPAGWRSAVFKLPAQRGTAARYSTYVRLHDPRGRGWRHGLVRLESFDPDLLGPLAARALVERQHAASGDARWDRHLASVAVCEKLLRARRPVVFNLG